MSILGYGENEFNYRLSDLINKKVIRSRDIVFMEENTIADWEMENKLSTTDLNWVDDPPNQTLAVQPKPNTNQSVE